MEASSAEKVRTGADFLFEHRISGKLRRIETTKAPDPQLPCCRIVVVNSRTSEEMYLSEIKGFLPEWRSKQFCGSNSDSSEKLGQSKAANSSGPTDSEIVYHELPTGPALLVRLHTKAEKGETPQGRFSQPSSYALARDRVGDAIRRIEDYNIPAVQLDFRDLTENELCGALVGFEVAGYSYLRSRTNPKGDKATEIQYYCQKLPPEILLKAAAIGESINISRHLVNLPAKDLHPLSYAESMAELFKASTTTSVSIWGPEQLAQQKLSLLLAVGQGAEHGPCLVRIRYRPKKATKWKKPLAIIGKGITFDSGGLDIKPSSSMRKMKKDMGGSASAVGIAYWLEKTQFPGPCDIYLCIAENSVSAKSFRPGDIFTTRSGLRVEIDNTDAEGRLVLADGIQVALEEVDANEPFAIIDLATLTGAARVALGTDVGALFCNDRKLRDAVLDASERSGDYLWELPLFGSYIRMLKSPVADMVNSSSGGMGGAITAALFLKKFVGDKPWAHLDIYTWSDDGQRPLREKGANGQGVQCLIQLFEDLIEL